MMSSPNPMLTQGTMKEVGEVSIVQSDRRALDQILQEIQELSVEERTALVQQLLGGTKPGVSITFGNNGSNHILRADLVVQINSEDKETIKTVAEALARRIER